MPIETRDNSPIVGEQVAVACGIAVQYRVVRARGLHFAPGKRADVYKKHPNLYLIDVRLGRVMGRHRVGNEQLTAVAYSPDGKTLLTGDNFGVIRAWNPLALGN